MGIPSTERPEGYGPKSTYEAGGVEDQVFPGGRGGPGRSTVEGMGAPLADKNDDPTVYPEEERVGEEMLQRWMAEFLRPLLERYLNLEADSAPSFVGADQFIYYRQFDPHRRFAPGHLRHPEYRPHDAGPKLEDLGADEPAQLCPRDRLEQLAQRLPGRPGCRR